MYRFQLTTTLYYGPDSLSALSQLSGRRVLIITDAFMATSQLMFQVREALADSTIEVYDKVIPNPDVAAVAAGLAAFLAFEPEALLAVGGGSPIDTAKAVRKLALELGHKAEAGFYVIPTTSGTGSEVTSFAVVTDPVSHAKLPLTSDDMLPDVAILDPDAVSTVPPFLVADSGMDAISHAIEAYVAIGHNDFSDALAEKALRIADTYLLRSYRSNQDVKARTHAAHRRHHGRDRVPELRARHRAQPLARHRRLVQGGARTPQRHPAARTSSSSTPASSASAPARSPRSRAATSRSPARSDSPRPATATSSSALSAGWSASVASWRCLRPIAAAGIDRDEFRAEDPGAGGNGAPGLLRRRQPGQGHRGRPRPDPGLGRLIA